MILFSRVSMFVLFGLLGQRPKLWNSKRRSVELALFLLLFYPFAETEKRNARSFCFFSLFLVFKFKKLREKKNPVSLPHCTLTLHPETQTRQHLFLSLRWIRVLKQWIFTTSGSLFLLFLQLLSFSLLIPAFLFFFLSMIVCVAWDSPCFRACVMVRMNWWSW